MKHGCTAVSLTCVPPSERCPECMGDGFEMGRDGPYPCVVCNWTGSVSPERREWWETTIQAERIGARK
jgi:hypothetical protein